MQLHSPSLSRKSASSSVFSHSKYTSFQERGDLGKETCLNPNAMNTHIKARSSWVKVAHQVADMEGETNIECPQFAPLPGEGKSKNSTEPTASPQVRTPGNLPLPKPVKITMEDIIYEVNYWESGVVCYGLGSNAPTCD